MDPEEPVVWGNGGAVHLGPGGASAGSTDSVKQGSLQVIGDAGSGILQAWEATCVRSPVTSF
jgi:hypothetical protein